MILAPTRLTVKGQGLSKSPQRKVRWVTSHWCRLLNCVRKLGENRTKYLEHEANPEAPIQPIQKPAPYLRGTSASSRVSPKCDRPAVSPVPPGGSPTVKTPAHATCRSSPGSPQAGASAATHPRPGCAPTSAARSPSPAPRLAVGRSGRSPWGAPARQSGAELRSAQVLCGRLPPEVPAARSWSPLRRGCAKFIARGVAAPRFQGRGLFFRSLLRPAPTPRAQPPLPGSAGSRTDGGTVLRVASHGRAHPASDPRGRRGPGQRSAGVRGDASSCTSSSLSF